ncbi:23S rRNA (pseudouridine(1915)-N(3))-methyltransferase RlmH [Foetidibacter luteolus]|uniref:23S rRNA (pseudouridine(1915)-N(3))-methyltransferase RlmH n=1 Tax=Foetidibacter luteolus TaxID=2608880 RepID=UPI00129A5198|nr:23S rRNA (pseudouridine(1915)-N(3))-methyltransferase RlmH [Foetidibacter luteolus]
MKIQFWSVGKPHEAYVKQGVEEFTKRVTRYFPADWLLIAPPKNAASLDGQSLKKQEGLSVLQQLQPDDYLILLDERGKQMSSPELAMFIQQRANESAKRLVFLIGGAFGVDEAVSKRASFTWSFSKLVFPHMLVRLMLAEQVYRACTILRNEKYHHE